MVIKMTGIMLIAIIMFVLGLGIGYWAGYKVTSRTFFRMMQSDKIIDSLIAEREVSRAVADYDKSEEAEH